MVEPRPLRIERVDPETAAALRAMTGAERVAHALDLWRLARGIVQASERHRHPDLDEQALARRVAERMSRGG